MITLRKALGLSALFLLLVTTACGGAAAPSTEAPSGPDYNFEPAATYEAPAATEAPASAPQQNGQPPSAEQPNDMFFEDYGVNPAIDAEDDERGSRQSQSALPQECRLSVSRLLPRQVVDPDVSLSERHFRD